MDEEPSPVIDDQVLMITCFHTLVNHTWYDHSDPHSSLLDMALRTLVAVTLSLKVQHLIDCHQRYAYFPHRYWCNIVKVSPSLGGGNSSGSELSWNEYWLLLAKYIHVLFPTPHCFFQVLAHTNISEPMCLHWVNLFSCLFFFNCVSPN